jgi:hypothetical protein
MQDTEWKQQAGFGKGFPFRSRITSYKHNPARLRFLKEAFVEKFIDRERKRGQTKNPFGGHYVNYFKTGYNAFEPDHRLRSRLR